MYTSTLTIVNITQEDYGTYLCKATNQLGMDQHSVHLADTSECHETIEDTLNLII